MTIRPPDDHALSQLADLMPLYMSETYGVEWRGSEQALRAAVTLGTLQVLVAASRPGRIDGFIAWTVAFDLHWCVRGGTVLDLYVRREARGRAVAIRLLAAAAAQVGMEGGTFLRGTAAGAATGNQLYCRAAVCNSTTECTVSGRAFRELAALERLTSREIVQRVPDTAGNYEP